MINRSNYAASSASWYQLTIFELDFACWAAPKPLSFCIVPMQAARLLRKHFYNKKGREDSPQTGESSRPSFLSSFYLLLRFCFFCKENFHVLLCFCPFLHFFFRFTVVWICCFLLSQQPSIFFIQIFYFGQLL